MFKKNMRDIRPSKPNRNRSMPPIEDLSREEVELYEVGQESKKRLKNSVKKALAQEPNNAPKSKPLPDKEGKAAFKGSQVPVSSIDIEHSGRHSNRDHHDTPRPLFARAKIKGSAGVRVGKSERKILIVIFGIVILAAGVAAMLFLPTANITLRLRTAPLLIDEQLIVGASKGAGDKVVPGTAFFREISVRGSVPVENKVMVGGKARGVAMIVNKTISEQKIKERSRLVTDGGQLFYMQKHAIIPPQSSREVIIEADQAGEQGNIEAQRLNFAALDESAQSVIYAEVEKKLSGGSGEKISVVSEKDIEKAKEAAALQAKQQAEREIKDKLPKGWVVLDESWTKDVESFLPQSEAGDKTPTIEYDAKVRVQVVGYEQEVFEEQLKTALENALDQEYMLFPGAISYTKTVKEVNWDDARVVVDTRVTHSTIPDMSIDTLKQKLSGRSLDEAKEYLEGLKGVKTASIEVWPFWVKSIPKIEKRIALDLQSDRD